MAETANRPPERPPGMSPFDGLPDHAVAPPQSRHHTKLIIAGAVSFALTLTVVVLIALFWNRTVNDPLRTLEVFSADRYFENPRALTGNKFQATLRVEGDLGWQAGVGKLMYFCAEGDSRYLPVLLKNDNLSFAFSKGQTYIAQIQIEDGGLIIATDLKKK